MPLIDVRCLTCGHIYEYMRPDADWPSTQPCEVCQQSTEQHFAPPRQRTSIDPVVVYRAPDGSYRFPGDADGMGAAKYSRQGFERIELRSAADVRRFESTMNKRELSRAHRRVEAMQANREARESATRSELRRLMPNMTEFGRAVARQAMQRNDAKPRERARDVNFHVEAFSYDHSNREESRDAQGRRRRD